MDWSETFDDVFRRVLGVTHLDLDDELTPAQVEGWDSVAHINLTFALEQALGIRFIGDEFGDFESLGDLRDVVAGKLSADSR